MDANNAYHVPAFVVEELTKAGVENDARMGNLWSLCLRTAGARICSPLDALTAITHLATTQGYSTESIQALMDHLIGAAWSLKKTNEFLTYIIMGKEQRAQGISWAVFYMFIDAAVKSSNTTPATSHPLAGKWQAWALSQLPPDMQPKKYFSWAAQHLGEKPSYLPPWAGMGVIRGVGMDGRPYTQADVLLNNGEVPDTVTVSGGSRHGKVSAIKDFVGDWEQERLNAQADAIPLDLSGDATQAFLDAVGAVEVQNTWADIPEDMDVSYNEYSAMFDRVVLWLTKVKGLSVELARMYAGSLAAKTLKGELSATRWDIPQETNHDDPT